MGILKVGTECIIIQGRDFGKKIKIEKVVKNDVFYKLKDKEVKLSIFHVFPI
jgi:hypothetical protein